MLRALAAGAALLFCGYPSDAYNIGTNYGVGPARIKLEDVHETITRLAEQCATSPTPPSRCWRDETIIKRNVRFLQHADRSLETAVRWSDDPTRQSTLTAYPKLGASLKLGCQRQIARVRDIDRAGLLCSSHYGRLQFLHAMKGIDDRDDAMTYDRILAWAAFTYDVASNRQPLDQDLCSATAARPGIGDAFKFADASRCATAPRRRFGRTLPTYTVRTLFTLRCRNPMASVTCWQGTATSENDRLARLAAEGALLHLIQDSYSQAHTDRSRIEPVPEKGPFFARVVCRFPKHFFDYGKQDSDVHEQADLPPARDASCDEPVPQADDVITASATAIWYLNHGRSTPDLLAYLQSRVFGPRPVTAS